MVACDVDGTLIDREGRVPEANLCAIRAAVAKGVRVVIASARPPRMAKPIYEALGLDTYQVNYNGAVIQRPGDEGYAVHRPMEPGLVRRLIGVARHVDPELAVSLEIKDRWLTDGVVDGLETATSLNLKPDYVGPLDAVLTEPVTKVLLLTPAERMGRLRQGIEAVFRKRVRLQVSDAHLIQVVHPQADKAHGLKWMAAEYGVSVDEILAIGDAPNDAGMLRLAGVGVAVKGAWAEAVAAADHVAEVDAAGGAVAWALERFVL